MAFPQTSAPAESSFSSASTTHNVSMPATVNAGDLLLVNMCLEASSSAPNVTTPSGWTQLWHTSSVGTSVITRYAGYAKAADGGEGGGTVNFATNVACTAAAQCYRVTNWYGSLAGVETGTLDSGGGTTPDPPSLTASWGSEDNLWFALSGAADDDQNYTSAPANYTGLVSTLGGGGTNASCEVGSARRELASATENPGTFTLQSTESWATQTIVVRPAAASLPQSRLTILGAG